MEEDRKGILFMIIVVEAQAHWSHRRMPHHSGCSNVMLQRKRDPVFCCLVRHPDQVLIRLEDVELRTQLDRFADVDHELESACQVFMCPVLLQEDCLTIRSRLKGRSG